MKIDRFLAGLEGKMEGPGKYQCMTVEMPGDLDPFERHERFAAPIDAELRLMGVGGCSGGGTLYRNVNFEDPDDEEEEIVSTILDIDATDVGNARELLRIHLLELGAPLGTLVHFGERVDRLDCDGWHLNELRED